MQQLFLHRRDIAKRSLPPLQGVKRSLPPLQGVKVSVTISPMNKRKIILAIPALVFSLWMSFSITGCATERLHFDTSTTISKEKVARIRKGTSTKEEINALFGRPLDTLVFEKGEAWFYKDINIVPLYIEFDASGIVSDFKTN
jgi:outer membrane protein assembly factor BamE (lipoprotein component of BamABCDE complex)